MKSIKHYLGFSYYIWLFLFVFLPIALLLYQSLFIDGHFTLQNYVQFFSSKTYLVMTANSIYYAFLITLFTLIVSYPTAYFLTKLKHKQLWLMLIILPTWINLLLKVYAFMGIFSRHGLVNQWLQFFNISNQQLLFTTWSFIFVAVYIQIPFMILPIFNSLEEIPTEYEVASSDLGANRWQTIYKVIIPLSIPGVKAGVQAVFIPSLSLFMLTRLIGGNKVITLGTAVEEHFLTTQNWQMGSTIGVILIITMIVLMIFTKERKQGGKDEIKKNNS